MTEKIMLTSVHCFSCWNVGLSNLDVFEHFCLPCCPFILVVVGERQSVLDKMIFLTRSSVTVRSRVFKTDKVWVLLFRDKPFLTLSFMILNITLPEYTFLHFFFFWCCSHQFAIVKHFLVLFDFNDQILGYLI